jgi:esterase/lipase superfamily enzyme
VHVIAHSMGNRAVAGAILALTRGDKSTSARVREIMLTAPDIDADVFRRDIALPSAKSVEG